MPLICLPHRRSNNSVGSAEKPSCGSFVPIGTTRAPWVFVVTFVLEYTPVSRKKSLPRIRLDYEAHPIRLYRPTRLAKLFDIDLSTLWRWRQEGLIPQPIEISPGFSAWREPDLKAWLDDLQSK